MTYENNGSALAVYPVTRGYGYVLFESAGAGADWGVRFIEGKMDTRNERTIADIESLLDGYHPDYLLLQDVREKGSNRAGRLVRLHESLAHAAQVRAIEVVPIRRSDVKAAFASVGAKFKHDIAQAVAREFPALGHKLPNRKRKAWEAESPKMALFDAAALAVVFYGRRSDS